MSMSSCPYQWVIPTGNTIMQDYISLAIDYVIRCSRTYMNNSSTILYYHLVSLSYSIYINNHYAPDDI